MDAPNALAQLKVWDSLARGQRARGDTHLHLGKEWEPPTSKVTIVCHNPCLQTCCFSSPDHQKIGWAWVSHLRVLSRTFERSLGLWLLRAQQSQISSLCIPSKLFSSLCVEAIGSIIKKLWSQKTVLGQGMGQYLLPCNFCHWSEMSSEISMAIYPLSPWKPTRPWETIHKALLHILQGKKL